MTKIVNTLVTLPKVNNQDQEYQFYLHYFDLTHICNYVHLLKLLFMQCMYLNLIFDTQTM